MLYVVIYVSDGPILQLSRFGELTMPGSGSVECMSHFEFGARVECNRIAV